MGAEDFHFKPRFSLSPEAHQYFFSILAKRLWLAVVSEKGKRYSLLT